MKNIFFLLPILLSMAIASGTASDSSSPQNGDLIYLGQKDEAMAFDGAWRILDNKKIFTKLTLTKMKKVISFLPINQMKLSQ